MTGNHPHYLTILNSLGYMIYDLSVSCLSIRSTEVGPVPDAAIVVEDELMDEILPEDEDALPDIIYSCEKLACRKYGIKFKFESQLEEHSK